MKIKLAICDERHEIIRKELVERGIEIDDHSDLVLTESDRYIDSLMVKDKLSNDRIVLPVEDIAYVETYGHLVEVHTSEMAYQAMDRLYKIAILLDPGKFLRVSSSVIIAKEKVKRITPTLSMKFILTMADGKRVDVTRSYYYSFKDFFGI